LVKNENGDLLADSQSILIRRKSYFSHLLNVHRLSDVGKTEIHSGEPLAPDPGPSEFELTITKLKKYKPPVSDKILAEQI
jgi:hypothetical protein